MPLYLNLTSNLVGGPERPPSKEMVEQMKSEDQERRRALKEGRTPSAPVQGSSQEGYWSYMSRQVQERTERLGIVGDSMDRLEENSSGFASDVGKYVQSQKKKAVLGGKSIFLQQVYRSTDPCIALTPLHYCC